METKKIQVADNLSISVIPDVAFEFLMTTSEVAKGYGVSSATLRRHKIMHVSELKEGKHYLISISKNNICERTGGYTLRKQILWTKIGVIRLASFIKSGRSKMFRDWAENIIVNSMYLNN